MMKRTSRRRAAFALLVAAAALAPASGAPAPVRATDGAGRAISLSSPARRVVSLSPAATEIVYAVGAGAALVGDTTYCDWPAAAKALPKVGGFAAPTISIERIISLRPDFVISAGAMHDAVEKALARLSVPVFAYDPADFASIAAGMRGLGELCGRGAEAARAADSMLADLDAVRTTLAAVPADARPKVFWEVYDEPLMTCGSKTFAHAIIEAAGGRDIFSDLPGSWPRVSDEEVIRRAPDWIMGADDHGDKLNRAAVSRRPGWGTMAAVRMGRIALVPADLVSRAGPRVTEGVRAIAAILYPELFK
jgi:iron complex transport system substrate-binding protein